MNNSRYFISDFVEIQRQSFLDLLKKGLITEFQKQNPIISNSKEVAIYFYPEYYKLTLPEYNTRQSILKCKSYTSKLYIPVQLISKKSNQIRLKWTYIGDLPLMTKRGHFILNGAPRVIINQIIRSPGIYYQEKIKEIFNEKWNEKAKMTYKRYYADLICLRGTWLRIEIDKYKYIWAQTKKGPKIPIFWLLVAFGLSERTIFNSIIEPTRLILNLIPNNYLKDQYPYVKNPPSAWKEIHNLINQKKSNNNNKMAKDFGRKWLFNKFMNPRTYDLSKQGRIAFNRKFGININQNQLTLTAHDLMYATDYLLKVEKGIKNLDDIDHLKNRRVRTSGELIQIQIGIGVVRLEKVIREKLNKSVIQNSSSKFFPISSEKSVETKINLESSNNFGQNKGQSPFPFPFGEGDEETTEFENKIEMIEGVAAKISPFKIKTENGALVLKDLINQIVENNETKKIVGLDKSKKYEISENDPKAKIKFKEILKLKQLTISNLINTKPLNSALREFFGTSPLSQFMDQINPLAEITHKRRLSSMGPGGVTRDSATLAIRGIHPTHYGRICPVETPEGKNTGLVNSMTSYARVNSMGILESPFYKVYKGLVLKSVGVFYFSADQEEQTKLAAADVFVSPLGFLANTALPVRIGENFTKIYRDSVEYIGISSLQMISIATSLIPFVEHDDANRALMGSNMQRQAVPLIRPERPIVGTGLESRAVSDSGHIIQAKIGGVVSYVSAQKIIITSLKR